MVLGALDGSLIGYRDVPARSNRWGTLGRRVLSFRQEGRSMKVRMADLLAESPNDWERSFAVESKGCVVERDKLAVVEPNGKFTLLNLDDGRVLIETPLEAEKSLQSIYVLPADDQFLLFTNSTYRENGAVAYQVPAIPDAPLVNGRVYAFERASGKSLWPSPAILEQWGLPLDQPTGTPVVLLMRRELRVSGGSAQRNVLGVLCLDRRDGSLIFQKGDAAPSANAGNDKYTLEADPISNAVKLILPNAGIDFTFTAEPVPPQPPFHAAAIGAAGARNLAREILGAVIPAVGGAPGLPAAVPPPPVQFVPQPGQQILPGIRVNAAGQLIPLFPIPQPANPANRRP
jgi:hypothetical protein